MKKTWLALLGALSVLCSCGIINGSTNASPKHTAYLDSPTVVNGNLTLTFSLFADNSQNVSSPVLLYLTLVSSNLKPVKFKVSDGKVTREANGAEYLADFQIANSEITLQCDMPSSFYVVTALPTNVLTEKYHFTFVGNSTPYRFNLYNSFQ